MTVLKHFKLIDKNLDIALLMEEINLNKKEFYRNTGRQEKISVQKDTETIFLQSAIPRDDIENSQNQEVILAESAQYFPKALEVMKNFAKKIGGELSRALIVKLKANGQIYSHVDVGAYYLIRNRYHLVLKSNDQCIFKSGNSEVVMREGELWWFDNKQHHSVTNFSNDYRIHYVFDILPPEYESLAQNPEEINI